MKTTKCDIMATKFHLCLSSLIGLGSVAFLMMTSFANAETSKPDFSWSQNMKYNAYESVHFASGGVLRVAEGPKPGVQMGESCDLKRLEIGKDTPKSEFFITNACDGIVHIRAAYPNLTNAKVAIASTNCGGTMCSTYSDFYVIFNGKYGLKIAKIGTNYGDPRGRVTNYSFWFKGDLISKSTITNFFDGQTNELGDLLVSTRNFTPQGAFIDSGFSKKYIELIGEHPESILSNESLRLPIVKIIKPEQFRNLRDSMSGPGYSTVANGRYIVFNGCMKHNCTFEYGSIILDGFTGELQAMQFNPAEKTFAFYTSRPLVDSKDYLWLDAVETNNKFTLRINDKKLNVNFNR